MNLKTFLVVPFLIYVPVLLAHPLASPQKSGSAKQRQVEVNFQNGDVRLAGTLLLPETEPISAMVVGHGSGPATRDEGRRFAERFVADGLAVLIFDKRGCGVSTGSWTTASLDDLADDLIAAATMLRSRTEIHQKQVGVWGVSQSGWLIPRALARSESAFDFAVIVSGGGVRPVEVETYDYRETLKRIQATPEEQGEASKLVDHYFEYLRTGQGREELERLLAVADKKRWGKELGLSRVLPSSETRSKWKWVSEYDPARDIQQLKIPVLVILGGQDRPGLAEIAEQRWLKGLHDSGDPNATVIVVMGGGHGLTVGEHHHAPESNYYATGYFELMDAWIRSHSGQ